MLEANCQKWKWEREDGSKEFQKSPLMNLIETWTRISEITASTSEFMG